MNTRMLQDEELRVMLAQIAHAQPRSIGPLAPMRNPEPLGERPGAEDFDDRPDWFDRNYRLARNRAIGVMALLVLAVGAMIVMGWWLS
jgi:hypothetical protein